MSASPGAGSTEHGATSIGDRLRDSRGARGLGLRELARRLDVSPSLVSQIETGKIQPSVRMLYAIANELGMSLDEAFEAARPAAVGPEDGRGETEPPDGEVVQRRARRHALELETGVRWERLTTHDDGIVEFLHAVYPPGGESSSPDRLVRHNGHEFGFVLSGRLRVTVGFDDYELGPGDAISFDSTVPHRLHNDGEEVATAVWAVLGRSASYGDARPRRSPDDNPTPDAGASPSPNASATSS